MPVRFNHSNQSPLYFITFTCFNWLPLFELTDGYDLVYKWFTYLREQKKYQNNSLCDYAQSPALHAIFPKS